MLSKIAKMYKLRFLYARNAEVRVYDLEMLPKGL